MHDAGAVDLSNLPTSKILKFLDFIFQEAQNFIGRRKEIEQYYKKEGIYPDLYEAIIDVLDLADYFSEEYKKYKKIISKNELPKEFINSLEDFTNRARTVNKRLRMAWRFYVPEILVLNNGEKKEKWNSRAEKHYISTTQFAYQMYDCSCIHNALKNRPQVSYKENSPKGRRSGASRSNFDIRFSKERGTLIINQKEVKLGSKQRALCEVFFSEEDSRTAWDVTDILETIGEYPDTMDKEDLKDWKKKFQDRVRQINIKIATNSEHKNYINYKDSKFFLKTII
jgi:hypothetical protein